MVPESGHGHAIHVAAYDRPGRVGSNNGHHDVAGDAESSVGEDAEVLEEDGELAACETAVVHGNGRP